MPKAFSSPLRFPAEQSALGHAYHIAQGAYAYEADKPTA